MSEKRRQSKPARGAAPRKWTPPPPAQARLTRILASKMGLEAAALLGDEIAVGDLVTLAEAATLLGAEDDAVAAVRAWGRENTRQARDALTAALRRALVNTLNHNADELGETMLAALRPWAEQEANPEGLAEWLGRGGWGKVDGDAVETRLGTAARAAAEAAGLQGITAFVWPSPNKPLLLLYDLPRAAGPHTEGDAPWKKGEPRRPMRWDTDEARLTWMKRAINACNRIMAASALRGHAGDLDAVEKLGWLNAPTAADLANILTPEWNTPPEPASIRLGLDALRAGLDAHDWPTLALCLTDKAGGNWLDSLAAAWVDGRADEAEAREARAARAVGIILRPKASTDAGSWTPLPRALTVAAALGGPLCVVVDGETYAPEPSLAQAAVSRALRPRALDIVPADWLVNPAQLSLGLDVNAPREAVREYLVETAARTAHLAQLPNMAPKLLGFMFGSAPMTGRPVKGTLLDMAHWLYPDWATGEGPTVKPWKERRQGPRDLRALGAAFVSIKYLRLIETRENGTRHPYDLFTLDYDLSCAPDAALGFMINPWLAERMKGGKGGGYFLLNMTRWLALGTQNPRLFPLALRLAALWDAARVDHLFVPDRLRPIEADRLAWDCNTLPEGAAMYRAGKTDAATAKRALAIARGNLEADLDALREAGLVGDWKPTVRHDGKGRRWTLLPVPPTDYAEACSRAAEAARKRTKKDRD